MLYSEAWRFCKQPGVHRQGPAVAYLEGVVLHRPRGGGWEVHLESRPVVAWLCVVLHVGGPSSCTCNCRCVQCVFRQKDQSLQCDSRGAKGSVLAV